MSAKEWLGDVVIRAGIEIDVYVGEIGTGREGHVILTNVLDDPGSVLVLVEGVAEQQGGVAGVEDGHPGLDGRAGTGRGTGGGGHTGVHTANTGQEAWPQEGHFPGA